MILLLLLRMMARSYYARDAVKYLRNQQYTGDYVYGRVVRVEEEYVLVKPIECWHSHDGDCATDDNVVAVRPHPSSGLTKVSEDEYNAAFNGNFL